MQKLDKILLEVVAVVGVEVDVLNHLGVHTVMYALEDVFFVGVADADTSILDGRWVAVGFPSKPSDDLLKATVLFDASPGFLPFAAGVSKETVVGVVAVRRILLALNLGVQRDGPHLWFAVLGVPRLFLVITVKVVDDPPFDAATDSAPHGAGVVVEFGSLELAQVPSNMLVHAVVYLVDETLFGIVVLDVIVAAGFVGSILVDLFLEGLVEAGRFDAAIDANVGPIDAYPELRGSVSKIVITPVNVEAVDHGSKVWVSEDVVTSCGPIFAVMSPTRWHIDWGIPDVGIAPDIYPSLLTEILEGGDVGDGGV